MTQLGPSELVLTRRHIILGLSCGRSNVLKLVDDMWTTGPRGSNIFIGTLK